MVGGVLAQAPQVRNEAGRFVHRETVGEVSTGDEVNSYVVGVVNDRFEGTVIAPSLLIALRVEGFLLALQIIHRGFVDSMSLDM